MNHGKSNLRPRAIELRTIHHKSLQEIATELSVSVATCSRWLKQFPLPTDEARRRAEVGFEKLKGKKQSNETVRKRVEASREKIRARALERFGGNWSDARQAGRITYISRKTCKEGHTERYVASRVCVQCQFDKGRSMGWVTSRLCSGAKWRAKKDSTPFNLTVEYLQSIWPTNGICPVLDTPMELRTGRGQRGSTPLSPTIDRIIPSLGYVMGNVAILSHKANCLKNDCIDPAVFRRLADWLETQVRK